VNFVNIDCALAQNVPATDLRERPIFSGFARANEIFRQRQGERGQYRKRGALLAETLWEKKKRAMFAAIRRASSAYQ